MMFAFSAALKWVFSSGLTRLLATSEKQISAETEREKLKAEIIKTHLQTRPSFMKAGGFLLMLIFAVPLAAWWSRVLLYSMFWCVDCQYPKDWTVAALPPPLDEWAWLIMLAIFGATTYLGKK